MIDVQIVESPQVEFPIKFGIELDENWVFGMKNRTSRQKPVVIPQFLTQAVTDTCRWALRSYAV